MWMGDPERERLLGELGLPPGVLDLALLKDPRGLFSGCCQPVDISLGFDSPLRAEQLMPPDVVPLWAGSWSFHDFVIGCRRLAGGLEYVGLELHTYSMALWRKAASSHGSRFWTRMNIWRQAAHRARRAARQRLGDEPASLDGPCLIARSEQGLLFWVFAEVLQDTDWSPPEAWKQELRQAAEMVGFRRLGELWDLVIAEGVNPNYLRDDPYDSAYAFFEGYEVELLTRTRSAQ